MALNSLSFLFLIFRTYLSSCMFSISPKESVFHAYTMNFYSCAITVIPNIPSFRIAFHHSALDNWSASLSSKLNLDATPFVLPYLFFLQFELFFHLHSCTLYISVNVVKMPFVLLQSQLEMPLFSPRSYMSLEDKARVLFIFEFFLVQGTWCKLLD